MLPPDLAEFLPLFIETARGRVQALNNALVKLGSNWSDAAEIENVFQNAHSLKGEAAMMQFTKLSHLMHVIEDAFYEIKKGHVTLTREISDKLFEALDAMEVSIGIIEQTSEESDVSEATEALKKITGVKTTGVGKSDHSNEAKTEEKQAAIHRVTEPINYLNISVASLDTILNIVEELLVAKLRLDLLIREGKYQEFRGFSPDWSRLIAELRYHVMKARLIPLDMVFERFPRMIRDIASSEDKDVEFVVSGGDTPLDRTVIDHISEPLVHLLRNAVDHGIESVGARKRLGKPEKGKIELRAERSRAYVIITIRDDGAGLDEKKILERAIEAGIVSQAEAHELNKQEVYSLIFEGVSTSDQVTEIAGRGVGMSVVRRAVESVGGSIKIDSEHGVFTEFSLRIPNTLSIIKALLVNIGDEPYAIPISVIDKSVRLTQDISRSVGGIETLVLDEEDVAVIDLPDLFGVKSSPSKNAVIVSVGAERIALSVSSLIKEEEVIVKTLPESLKTNRLFSGVTILGTGRPALILDVLGIYDTGKKRIRRG